MLPVLPAQGKLVLQQVTPIIIHPGSVFTQLTTNADGQVSNKLHVSVARFIVVLTPFV